MAKSSNTIIFRNFNAKAINASSNPIFKNIAYVLNPDKVAASFYHNLSENEWEKETNIVLDKFSQKGGRIAFHSVISASGGITHTDLLNGTKDFIAEFFAKKGTYQIVAAVHSNTSHPHVHIVGSTIDILSGKRLQLSNNDLYLQRNIIDEIFSSYGFPLRGHKSSKDYSAASTTVVYDPQPSSYVDILLSYQAMREHQKHISSIPTNPYGDPCYSHAYYDCNYVSPLVTCDTTQMYAQPATTELISNTQETITLPSAIPHNPFPFDSLLPQPKPPTPDPYCVVCNERLSDKVFFYSLKEFNVPLCFDCQKDVRAKKITIPESTTTKELIKPFVGVGDLKVLTDKVSKKLVDEIIIETNFYEPALKVLKKHCLL
ncbi:relaxase/mobilization nuclease domain-containing protein [Phascolarctobacterium sp.]|uniref:relaxase/mobilization nuclease domain-containing protein n=1 Tax=Phascolarctobacterium sp. TaxID=2049039 RepID=UPI00386490DE